MTSIHTRYDSTKSITRESVCCRFRSDGIICSYLFQKENNIAITVNREQYRSMILNFMWCKRNAIDTDNTWSRYSTQRMPMNSLQGRFESIVIVLDDKSYHQDRIIQCLWTSFQICTTKWMKIGPVQYLPPNKAAAHIWATLLNALKNISLFFKKKISCGFVFFKYNYVPYWKTLYNYTHR